MKRIMSIFLVIPILCVLFGCEIKPFHSTEESAVITAFDMKYVPEYHGVPYCDINNGVPFFKDEDMTVESFEYYSPLDELGRCGECIACIGRDMMPTEKREGWSSPRDGSLCAMTASSTATIFSTAATLSAFSLREKMPMSAT